MNVKSIAVVLGATAFLAAGAIAQPRQSGLVNVEVSNVANDIARNLSVDVGQIPVTVQVPIGVAATVCGVAANVLGQQAASGNAGCTATTTNEALNNIVQQQVRRTTNR
jgi:hypothetical protein